MKLRRTTTTNRIVRTLRHATLLLAGVIMTTAPVAQASISQSEILDGSFVKWPLYQKCSAAASLDGIVISGESAFLTGDPLTLKFPNSTNDAAFAAAMQAFMERQTARAPKPSPWLQIPDVSARLVSEGRAHNINPMLVVAIGLKETGLGTVSAGSVLVNNSFGQKAGSGYKYWPSFEASLFGDDSFIKGLEGRTSDPASARTNPYYRSVTNMYEYVSVHLSGQIIYPGDTTKSHDSLMDLDIDAKNVVGYFGKVRDWIGQMTGLSISGIPAQGASTIDAACGTTSGTCGVNSDGYAFPLEPCTKIQYQGLPCKKGSSATYTDVNGKQGQIRTCHHEDTVYGYGLTPAFDLYYGNRESDMDGKAVYALTDGKIYRIEPLNGVCEAIQFKSSKDTFFYWYGHLQNVDKYVKAGQEVKAGQQIAEIAGHELQQKGCSPGPPHLHIDRGCISSAGPQTGGWAGCRDPAFEPLMRELWEGLPG